MTWLDLNCRKGNIAASSIGRILQCLLCRVDYTHTRTLLTQSRSRSPMHVIDWRVIMRGFKSESSHWKHKNYRQELQTETHNRWEGGGGGNMAKIWQHARGVKRGVKKRKIDIIRPASPRPSFNTPRGFNWRALNVNYVPINLRDTIHWLESPLDLTHWAAVTLRQ